MVSWRRKAESWSCLIFCTRQPCFPAPMGWPCLETRPTSESSALALISPFPVWTRFTLGNKIMPCSKNFQAVLSLPLKSGKLWSCCIVWQHNVVEYLGTGLCIWTSPNKPKQSIKTAAKACKTSWSKLTGEEMQADTSKAPDKLKSENCFLNGIILRTVVWKFNGLENGVNKAIKDN